MPPDETNSPTPGTPGTPGHLTGRTPDPARYSQGPRGTRDFYPLEMAKRRWIEEKWRKVSVRHGFDEIDGPRFEHLDTYTVKSGEGIVSELFSFTRAGGETEFALRPEFTPTLARMVAAKANALPKPIKWFSVGPYFRAERPQRGRLREFLQWNVDMVGDPSPEADAEVIACCVEMLRECGLTEKDVRVRMSNRHLIAHNLAAIQMVENISDEVLPTIYAAIDALPKEGRTRFRDRLSAHISSEAIEQLEWMLDNPAEIRGPDHTYLMEKVAATDADLTMKGEHYRFRDYGTEVAKLYEYLASSEVGTFVDLDLSIVRGLAYYTGTVFEVHEASGAERAIAGGGRYDNLVELFGGPSTPAVGFAMGDVVLALVLQDKGLMPSDEQIARDLGLTPEVFVFSVDESLDAKAAELLAQCRRAGMHARKSYKTTRNVGKLLKDASTQRARFAAFVEPSPDGASFRVQVKDLQGGGQASFPTIGEAIAHITSAR
ncbi:MAG: histidine--tRNA ligase [Phycisphaeraceae bacterium]|nr:histidine--tRNA ligase [Phycisphaeraceae bacterium]